MDRADARSSTGLPRALVLGLLLSLVAVSAAQADELVVIGTEQARGLAAQRGLDIRLDTPDGLIELMAFVNGVPKYYMTHNVDAAESVSTDECLPGGSSGLGLTGSGVTLGIWDASGVRTSHQEYGGRASQIDSPGSTHYHSTHVAGTMIASGVVGSAKGMSPAADLDCWDWDSDESEIRTAAGNGLLVSNHSYSYITGWYYSWSYYEWFWYGDVTVSTTEDNWFGLYTSYTEELDDIAYDNPYYLMCRSAGNDRNDDGPGPGGGHYYWNGSDWDWSTTTRDPDGPWDCIGTVGVAKNILSVAAVEDVSGGYSGPGSVTMSYFSSYGPADDGRIKPDIAANGIELYSCDDDSNSDYTTLSGTSMSSPNASGSLGLLIEHYRDTHSNADMRSATLKGLVLHTADECGSNDGPDYQYGWGLMNTLTAAETISEDASEPLTITEQTLTNGGTIELYATTDSSGELRASICWTDVPGTPPGNLLNPTTKMLVNDLNLRVIKSSPSTTYYPWVLNPSSPSSAATTGDNNTDNVEQVVVDSPGTNSYTIRITHDGSLSGGSQAFSLIITGAATISENPCDDPIITDHPDDATVCEGGTAIFNVSATGTGTLHYQWYQDGSPVGSDSSTLTLSGVTLGDDGSQITCQVSDDCGSATSNAATLTVNDGQPTITAHPDDVEVCEGGTAIFNVSATGTGTLHYQWYQDSSPVGSDSSTLTLSGVTLGDDGSQITCQVSDDCGSATSNAATLTVNDGQPTITAHPDDVEVCEGGTAIFNVSATGTGTLHYQWYQDSSPVGSDSSTLTLSGVTLGDDGSQITCQVSDDCGSATSNAATLTVNDGQPTITAHPDDVEVCEGGTAIFNVSATGSGTLHYQWYQDASPVGGDSSTLTLNNVQPGDDGSQITCQVSDDCGSATSNAATLTVQENHAPVADAGGAYAIQTGSDLQLDGSGSSDPDGACGDSIVSYEWDLNDDGVVDVTSPDPQVVVTWAELSALTPPLTDPGENLVELTVWDTFDASDSAWTTLTIYLCFGDIDYDGDIDIADLAELLAHYGTTSGALYADGDLNEDGDVDISDLADLLAVYGTTCP